jgi:hypothetical protein
VGLYISNEKSYEASGLDVSLRYFVHAIYSFQQIPWRVLRNSEASSSSDVVRSIQRENLYFNIVGIVNRYGNKHSVDRRSHHEIFFTIGEVVIATDDDQTRIRPQASSNTRQPIRGQISMPSAISEC